MQHLEGGVTPVLYTGRTVLKGLNTMDSFSILVRVQNHMHHFILFTGNE